ncbi:MAG: efflux RND transporter permease subunit [Deltaproteobacteria bacterium]|nr:efflux RND transporter permease subunit [Deltaproteobacteria bacterium]
MNLPSFSERRPVLTTMVTLIVIVVGTISLWRIQIDLLPEIELPTLSIRTEYEGASPEVMERLVTQIVEEIVATVPGVEEITSQSSEGISNVQVTFVWGTDIDTAAVDVRGKLEDEINELPEEIVRPTIRKFDITSFPVLILGISSKLDPVELTEVIEDQIRHRFSRIPGVAQVDLWGGFNREVRVELYPDRIKALGLPLNKVLQSIRDANLDLPVGQLEQGRHEVILRAPAEFTDLDQIRRTVVAVRDAAAVTVEQIATVSDTYEKLTRIIRVNRERGIRLAIRKQANANTVEVSRRVLEEVAAINQAMPQLEIVPVIDQGNFIERSIANLTRSVLYGGALAILLLWFFLANLRSTLIIALAIPISLVATFALVYFGGFTLNLMTLGGLALGVGMMVDSSIVVLENIFRRRDELGETAAVAAVQGANEVGPAIVASTITTVVVFLPLGFVRGVSGILFRELAYVVVFSLLCSLLVAMSLVPMLMAKLAPARETHSSRAVIRLAERVINSAQGAMARATSSYRKSLDLVLTHRTATVAVSLALLVASFALYPWIGSEFLPPSDEGEVRVTGEMEIGTRLAIVDHQTREMEKVVRKAVPEMVSSVTSVGASGRRANEVSRGEIRLSLAPVGERKRSNLEIAAELRARLEGRVPGMSVRVRAPQGQFLLERLLGGDEGLTIEVRGFELETLDALARRTAAIASEVPGITDVDTTRDPGAPQREIRIDREKVADLGLSVRDVTEALQTAVTGSLAGEFRAKGNAYPIRIKLRNAELLSIDEILGLTLTTATGEQVVLRNLVDTRASRGPLLIDRKDQQRIVAVQANVAGRSLGEVAVDLQKRLREVARPTGYELTVAGDFKEQQKAFAELLFSLLLAVLLVYMVLASQYESLINPLIVMLSVPVAAIGVLVTLFMTATTLNVQSFVGIIMLGGIVVNNAILLVDQAARLKREGMEVNRAVAEAGRRRLRPILMTTLTTALGLLPLALGIGEGADAQAPLARAVIGGLVGATPITLLLIPAVYSLVHAKRARSDG